MISKKEKKRTLSRDNNDSSAENIMQKKTKISKTDSTKVLKPNQSNLKNLKNKKPLVLAPTEEVAEKTKVSNLLRVKKVKQTSNDDTNKVADQPKKKQKTQVPSKNIPMTLEALKEKIKSMEDKELTKSGRKRLAFYKRKLRFTEQGGNPDQEPSHKSLKPVQTKAMKDNTLSQKAKAKKGLKPKKVQEDESFISLDSTKDEPEEDDSESEDMAVDNDDDEAETSEAESHNDIEKDDDDDESDDDNEKEDEDKNEDDNDDDDDDDDDEEEEEENTVAKSKPIVTKQVPVEKDPKKTRYVLFAGNLPFTIKEDKIKQHFLTKVDKIKDVRIPKKPNSEQTRGFAYIELFNQIDYEKALSLHETFLEGRKINVQYSSPGAKFAANKNQVIGKNKKLQQMRKTGKLAGSKMNKKGISQKYHNKI